MTAALGVLALSLATLGWLCWLEWSDRRRRWVDVDARIREAERLTRDGRWVGLAPGGGPRRLARCGVTGHDPHDHNLQACSKFNQNLEQGRSGE